MNRPLLGGHVSATGGLFNAPSNGASLGFEAIQFFGASPRQWKASLPNREVVDKYSENLKESGIKAVFLHASYLVNLATSNKELLEKSVESLSTHLDIAGVLGARGLIFHVGSTKEEKREVVLDNVVRAIGEVLKRSKNDSMLIIENSSGGGGKVAATIEESAYLMNKLKIDRIGYCLDTAHACGSGLTDFTPESIEKFSSEWDNKIGLSRIVALHANDSKESFGSLKDRHENIGMGHIGKSGFINLASSKKFNHAAWIMEVPGFDDGGPDRENLEILNSCVGV